MMGMDQMGMQDEGQDVEAKLQVLQEIKDLMDQRLGDKMKPSEVSMEKVSLGGDPEEQGESPEMEASEMGGDDSGLSDEDKEKLKMMYSGLKG